MPGPYSLDLRERVISFVDSGETISSASSLFNVARNTVCNWLSLREATKSLAPKEGYQKGHSHKIKDYDAFKQFVDANAGDTLEMIAQKLGNISDTTIGRNMNKIGYTRKKRRTDMLSAAKRKARSM